jgi:bifunctional lysine-specific demethylase and histidyl-hydroxylase NO66
VGDPARFVAGHWGRWPLHNRGTTGFEDLLTFADVDHLIAGAALRLPMFRLVKDGQTVPTSRYTKRGRIGSEPVTGIADPPRLFEQFGRGGTIVLQGMHRFWPPLSRFCRDLEMALGHPTQVNAYVTPPGSRGLAVHTDGHDVFVLQAFGRKAWEVHEPGRPATDPGPAVLSVELEPGDALYLPRDTPHAARTQEEVSGHITIGVPAWTWADVARELLVLVERDERFRERLPVGYHRDVRGFAEETRSLLEELGSWVDKVDPVDAASLMVRRFLTTRPPLVEGTLPGLLEAGGIEDGTVVRRVPGSVCEPVVRGSVLFVFLGDRELRMPASIEPAVRFVAAAARLTPGDLAEWLDEPGRLTLVRRLVREGLLTVESAANA